MKENSVQLQREKCFPAWDPAVRQEARRFAVLLAVALVAHFQMIANGLQNPDSLWLGGDYHIADSWELSLGRWGLVLVDLLRGGFVSPILSGVGMLVLYTAAGMLLVRVLEAQNSRPLRWLIPLTVVLAPQVLITESYLFCSIAYALAFLLAVAAAYWVQRLPRWPGILLGALFLMASLSLYQSNVGVTAGLLLMWLLRTLLDEPEALAAFARRLGRTLLACALGLVAYYMVLQLRLYTTQVALSGYKGADSVGVLHALTSLGTGIPQAYRDFFDYFFGRTLAANYYHVRPVYALLFVLAAVALAVRLWQIRRHRVACLLAVVLVVLLPLAVAAIDLIVPETTLILLTCSPLLTVVPFVLTLCARYMGERRLARAAVWLAVGLTVVLLRGYLLQLNTDSTTLLASQRTTLTVAQSLLQDLQQRPEYRAGMPVAIIGQPESGNYPNLSPCYDKADSLMQMGLLFHSPHANAEGWQQIFKQYLGVALNWSSREQVMEIVNTPEYQMMAVYPQEGSLQEIQGCLVARVA